ncbi:MAG: Cna B-type domain-containing protein, partial [Anaerolineaceae bacterium]|nr:Cna B-type domain-containing protein [Anaerolineaceae bacterium]
ISGYNVTNTHEIEKIDISGSKTWVDNNNQDGKRPDSITIRLLADGTEVDSKTVTAADNWAYSFEDLDKYAEGTEIAYTISEDTVEGYTTVYDGYNVTNTHTPEVTTATVTKVWEDADNQDGRRPANLTVMLSNYGTVTLNEANGWTATVENLPKYGDGKLISYTWTEGEMPEGYELTDTSVNGTVTTLTNTYVAYRVRYDYIGTVPAGVPSLPVDNNRYPEGETVDVAADRLMPGYTFSGWSTEDASITAGEFTMPGKDVLIVGSWTPNPYTVTYVYTGDIPANVPALPYNGDSVTYYYGENVPSAAVPTLEGYTFSGWEGEVSVMPAHDVIVPGSWTINRWPVTYVYDGEVPEGAPEVPPTVSYEYGKNVPNAPVPTLDGYRFVGWEGEVTTMPDHAVTVHGHWEKITEPENKIYTVTYVYVGTIPEGAPELPETKSYHAGDPVPSAEVPSMDSYDFKGWTGEVSTMPAANVTVIGQWVPLYYTVTIRYVDVTTGREILESVTIEKLMNGDTYFRANPDIPGYIRLSSEFVSGTISGNNVVVTVLYAPAAPEPSGDPDGGTEPNEEGTPETPVVTLQTINIEDFETPLGLGGLNINVGECIE